MTVNEKLIAALSNMVDGNIWANFCPLETTFPEQWIVFYPDREVPRDYGDDTDLVWMHYMSIHWVHMGNVDYYKARNDMRAILKEWGFTVTSIEPYYDHDMDATHMIMTANIIEDDLNG